MGTQAAGIAESGAQTGRKPAAQIYLGTFVTTPTLSPARKPCELCIPQPTIDHGLLLIQPILAIAGQNRLRAWTIAFLRVIWGAYSLLTSIYCLVAFLPYTYISLIKGPPYAWIPWFAAHQAALYWGSLLLFGVSVWLEFSGQGAASEGVSGQRFFQGGIWERLLLFGFLATAGLYITSHPFLPSLQNNWAAYRWSLLSLLPLLLTASAGVVRNWPSSQVDRDHSHYSYLTAGLIGVFVAAIYKVGTAAKSYFENRPAGFDRASLELAGWSMISHVLVAIIVISALNVILTLSWRTRRAATFKVTFVGVLACAALWIVITRFLNNALSFEGWAAELYSASLAATLTLFTGALVLPRTTASARSAAGSHRRSAGLAALGIIFSLLAIALPTLISGSDWNGVLEHSFALLFWIIVCICAYSLWPRRASYSVAGILGVLVLAASTYKGLELTEIYWAAPLGNTDDDVGRAMQAYAAEDASFELAHYMLGHIHDEPCGDLCRILREHTNIRNAEVRSDLRLVNNLKAVSGERPNIFFFVIDSLRPDYLGAYNPQVDFTPNLDAFAHDSAVIHNVYTQYAGTSLSEPAIWAGAMLLHAHYMQPFEKVNSLEKLARVDGYKMAVSYDEVLSQLLAPSDDLIKLDTDKKVWNQIEVCSTIEQTEKLVEDGLGRKQPLLFYTQPKNVHQFASNHLPRMTEENWRPRSGFNNRVAYEVHQVDDCMGEFLAFLQAQGLYDNSLIILTSDHGDSTGELGRYSHSLSIYPEVMRVPLIVHLPKKMHGKFLFDDTHLSALTDITPSIYYLLGHRPLVSNPFVGHPLFVESKAELDRYRRNELFLASDERAVYGMLTENGRYLYTTYDSPAQSFLFDLSQDPNALHSALTPALKQEYDQRIIERLQELGDFYGYKPGVGSLLAAK